MTTPITRIFSREEIFSVPCTGDEYSCAEVLGMPTRQDIAEGRAPGPEHFPEEHGYEHLPTDEVRALYGGTYNIENGDASANPFEREAEPAPAPKKRRAASQGKPKASKSPRATKKKP